MIYLASTALKGDWEDSLNHLPFTEHTDKDLLNNQAVALKSEDGKYTSFYRSKNLEKPKDYSFTSIYYEYSGIKRLVDFFELESTRIRIHKQNPGVKVALHSDFNNEDHIDTIDNYRVRIMVPLNYDKHFIYHFHDGKKHSVYNFKKGQIVTFDPDLVYHGTENNSQIPRYLLVMVVKPNKWLYSLHNSKVKREIYV